MHAKIDVIAPLVFSAASVLFTFKRDRQRNLWRLFVFLCVLVGGTAIVFGTEIVALIFGAGLPLCVPVVYFGPMGERQFSLLDVLLFVLLEGGMAAAAFNTGVQV